jgi:hypothetical protein
MIVEESIVQGAAVKAKLSKCDEYSIVIRIHVLRSDTKHHSYDSCDLRFHIEVQGPEGTAPVRVRSPILPNAYPHRQSIVHSAHNICDSERGPWIHIPSVLSHLSNIFLFIFHISFSKLEIIINYTPEMTLFILYPILYNRPCML